MLLFWLLKEEKKQRPKRWKFHFSSSAQDWFRN